jgi:hypothetical protein
MPQNFVMTAIGSYDAPLNASDDECMIGVSAEQHEGLSKGTKRDRGFKRMV